MSLPPDTRQNLMINTLLVIVLISLAVYAIGTRPSLERAPISLKYKDPTLPIDERVEDLLAQMTLGEKIGQMALVEKNSIQNLEDVRIYGLGGILSGAGAQPEENTPAGWLAMTTAFAEQARSSRLGIPNLYGVDAIHGHSNVLGATVFPHAIALGAAGDMDLVKRVAEATALELAATGIYWNYSPTLDLPEDIRWGRVYESFSSDPTLAGELGEAYIEGLQNGRTPVGATAKHYLGAGSMVWNSSSNPDFKIDQGQTPINEERLYAVYLPVFKQAVEAGVVSVMAGLNSWGDDKISASRYLLQDKLKDELGFEGFVVSDWYGVYEISNNDFLSAVVAVNAGVDMVMLPFDYKAFVQNLSLAIRLGVVKEARINEAVRRILKAKFALGLFDQRSNSELEIVGSTEHRLLAREAVARSLVLLKNEESLLPLKNGVGVIRVAGSAADNIGQQAGAWTVEWQGIDGNWLPGATSILDGLRQLSPEGQVIEYERDGHFPIHSPKAEVGIAVVGETPYAEGWGDNDEPKLSPEDLQTIERLRESSERVIVVLVTGRPLFITNEIENWDAVVVAWLSGSEGAGVADVLFGQKTFEGKLPIDWPATTSQLPITTKGQTADGTSPLFKRGFGLE